jgi:hypothetical protein
MIPFTYFTGTEPRQSSTGTNTQTQSTRGCVEDELPAAAQQLPIQKHGNVEIANLRRSVFQAQLEDPHLRVLWAVLSP